MDVAQTSILSSQQANGHGTSSTVVSIQPDREMLDFSTARRDIRAGPYVGDRRPESAYDSQCRKKRSSYDYADCKKDNAFAEVCPDAKENESRKKTHPLAIVIMHALALRLWAYMFVYLMYSLADLRILLCV